MPRKNKNQNNQTGGKNKKSKNDFIKGTPIMTTNNTIKNKTLSSIMSSAKKNHELLGEGMDMLDGLKSDKGIDRVKTIGEIIAKIYDASA